MKRLFSIIAVCAGCCTLFGNGLFAQQEGNVNKQFAPFKKNLNRKEIVIPDVNHYKVLTADFHIHTVFSDGMVWPTYRVKEAWADGLDVMAITDHIEYRPHKAYISGDLNDSYKIAAPVADQLGILLIQGTEITRKQGEIGHYNALFIQDANELAVKDAGESIRKAYEQGAYIIFNHPGWAVDTCMITPFQKEILATGMIGGIEVVNNHEYYPRVLSWSRDMDLTVISASDAHDPVSESFYLDEDNRKAPRFRPMTLLFVDKDKYAQACTLEGEAAVKAKQACIREALDNKKTLGYFDGNLVGREALLEAFFRSSVEFVKTAGTEKKDFYKVINHSSFPYKIKAGNSYYLIDPLSTISVSFAKGKQSILAEILNMHCYEFVHPRFNILLP